MGATPARQMRLPKQFWDMLEAYKLQHKLRSRNAALQDILTEGYKIPEETLERLKLCQNAYLDVLETNFSKGLITEKEYLEKAAQLTQDNILFQWLNRREGPTLALGFTEGDILSTIQAR